MKSYQSVESVESVESEGLVESGVSASATRRKWGAMAAVIALALVVVVAALKFGSSSGSGASVDIYDAASAKDEMYGDASLVSDINSCRGYATWHSINDACTCTHVKYVFDNAICKSTCYQSGQRCHVLRPSPSGCYCCDCPDERCFGFYGNSQSGDDAVKDYFELTVDEMNDETVKAMLVEEYNSQQGLPALGSFTVVNCQVGDAPGDCLDLNGKLLTANGCFGDWNAGQVYRYKDYDNSVEHLALDANWQMTLDPERAKGSCGGGGSTDKHPALYMKESCLPKDLNWHNCFGFYGNVQSSEPEMAQWHELTVDEMNSALVKRKLVLEYNRLGGLPSLGSYTVVNCHMGDAPGKCVYMDGGWLGAHYCYSDWTEGDIYQMTRSGATQASLATTVQFTVSSGTNCGGGGAGDKHPGLYILNSCMPSRQEMDAFEFEEN